MENMIYFIAVFAVVYLFYLVLVILRKKNLNKYRNGTEIRFLEHAYKVNIEKVGVQKLSHVLAACNAFIIAITVTIISFIPNLILKLLGGFIIVVPLILGVYYLVGKKYGNKK